MERVSLTSAETLRELRRYNCSMDGGQVMLRIYLFDNDTEKVQPNEIELQQAYLHQTVMRVLW